MALHLISYADDIDARLLISLLPVDIVLCGCGAGIVLFLRHVGLWCRRHFGLSAGRVQGWREDWEDEAMLGKGFGGNRKILGMGDWFVVAWEIDLGRVDAFGMLKCRGWFVMGVDSILCITWVYLGSDVD